MKIEFLSFPLAGCNFLPTWLIFLLVISKENGDK